jgi:L-asparagine transporter-like permease
MGMGGAIGAGFLLGSGSAIHAAGPALLLGYALGGAILYLLMRALGEMALAYPSAGSFSAYATRFLGPRVGFVTGWSYWLVTILVGTVEITAVGILLRHWYPGVAQWLATLCAAGLLYAINMTRARSFGEMEYWLAIVKVITLLSVLGCGVTILLLGIGEVSQHSGMANLWRHGGFFPMGFSGLLAALPVVLFAFGGVEVLALAAAETEKPQEVLPRAIRGLFYRTLLIYVGSLAIVMMLFPWNTFDQTTSPFILVLQRVGLSGAESVMTWVAITAVLSSGNSVLFAGSRMLRNLASSGQAPPLLQTLNRQGVPYLAVSVCALAMLVGVGFNYLMPERVFGDVMNTVGWMVLLVWANIMVTHIFYRRAISQGNARRVAFRLPGAPYTNWLVLGTIGFAAIEMVAHGGGTTPPLLLLCWLVCLILVHRVVGPAGRLPKD